MSDPNHVGPLNRIGTMQAAYASESTAGKALAALSGDLKGGKLKAATRKQIEAMASDESFAGSTVLRVLQEASQALENSNGPESDEGNNKEG